jgi:hypothetical protein
MSTALLLHFDEYADTTVFIDASGNNQTITGVSAAKTSNVQSKFGGGSLFCSNGAEGYATVSQYVDVFALYPRTHWTIDWWQYANSVSAANYPLSTIGPGGIGMAVISRAATGLLTIREGIGGFEHTFTGSITSGQWQHIAIVQNGTSGTITAYIDGVDVGSVVLNYPVYCLESAINSSAGKIGGHNNTSFFNGYIDEFRVSHDVALWTANFTPPTAPDVGYLAIYGINPSKGPTAGGNGVTVKGAGFIEGTTVTIDGNAVTGLTIVNDTTITGIAPAGTLGFKDVVVIAP